MNICSNKKKLTQRSLSHYGDKDQGIMEKQKKIILLEIDINNELDKSVIYENQRQIGSQLTTQLMKRNIINIMIIALTQSGKTGAMISLIKYYLHSPDNIIPIENIYIITGLSSKDWVMQTKDRFPRSIEDRVFHRGQLTKAFIKDIKGKKNCLIIMDEIQIAAKENQTINKSFNKAGFYDLQYLLRNDIKIIEFTATPDGTIYDIHGWGIHSSKIMMEPGHGYTSCFNLLKSKRVKQYKNLCCFNKKINKFNIKLANENISEIKELVDKMINPMYHIIRTPNALKSNYVIENFKRIFGEDMTSTIYDGNSVITNINDILIQKPNNHHFIFIKEKMRCAITLKKKYLGILYERCPMGTPHDTTIIQGLLGRATGYDDNGISIIFTNIESINKYKILWDSKFEDKSVKWVSKTTKYVRDIIQPKNTYKNPNLIEGMEPLVTDSYKEIDPCIMIFNTFIEAKKECKKRFNCRGPNQKKKE